MSALAQGRGLAHLSSGFSQTPRSLQASGAFAGRPLVPQLTQRSRTHRQKDVVVAVAAKPVPTMVTETPKVKEVKESGSSKHDLTPEVAADICELAILPIGHLGMRGTQARMTCHSCSEFRDEWITAGFNT